MKYIYLFVTSFLFQNISAQSKIKIGLPKTDTIIFSDRSDFIPKYTFDFNPFIKIYPWPNLDIGAIGFFLKAKIQLNEKINTNFELNEHLFDNYTHSYNKQVLLSNFLFSFEYNLRKKAKFKKSFYFKKIHYLLNNASLKSKVNYQKVSFLKLNVGIRKTTQLNRLIKTKYFVTEDYYFEDVVLDDHFDNSEEKFDFDGFLNEIKTIKTVNNYSLNIGFSSSVIKNYIFTLNKQKVKRNYKSEFYSNFIYGLLSTYKYDNRISNPKIEDDFKGRVDYKRLGWNLGYQFTMRSKNSQSGFNINLEIGAMPELRYNSNFLDDVSFIYVQSFDHLYYYQYQANEIVAYQFYNKRNIYLQFSLGYTFGQKIKPSKQ